jgi:hypothetical protein
METLSPLDCRCVTLSNLAVVEFGNDESVFRSLKLVERRGEPYWWLGLYDCTVCGTAWLVGQEERLNDLYVLLRLSAGEAAAIVQEGNWPSAFDCYATLLRIGRDHGTAWRFVDPADSRLERTIIDLAQDSPGIGVAEISDLLNLTLPEARALCRKAVGKASVRITL